MLHTHTAVLCDKATTYNEKVAALSTEFTKAIIRSFIYKSQYHFCTIRRQVHKLEMTICIGTLPLAEKVPGPKV